MRFAIAAVLALCLSTPVMAQQSNGQPVGQTGGRVFGNATCHERIPCAGDATHVLSAAGLAATANACVAQNFGLTLSGGYFDENAGLGSNSCLTLKPDIAAKGGTPPQCCMMTLPDNSCAFQCTLVSQ